MKDYIQKALKTENKDMKSVADRLQDEKLLRLNHAAMGMATEAAEFMDTLKKHMYYGKDLDEVNLKEEIADSCWYMAIALDALGSSFEEVQATNIEKLKARYGDKFTEEAAINRDLKKERKILEE